MNCIVKHFLLAFIIAGIQVNANAQSFTELLQAGKDSIKKERSRTSYEKSSYVAAIGLLEAAAKIKPDDPEVLYFLGSAYDYDNSSDATYILQQNVQKTIKASAEFEKIIGISPKYMGEIIALDPYSKISSIWGSLAFCYSAGGKKDSALWAFAEGRKRGGFGKFPLEYFRAVMARMEQKAIFFTYGDFSTMNLWYLQQVEHLRPDISVVNLSMLAVPWYTELLYKETPSLFSSNKVVSDTTQFKKWETTVYNIQVRNTGRKFDWTVEPVYAGEYIFRNDLELIDIVTTNKFNRLMYFEKGVSGTLSLGLTDSSTDCVAANLFFPGSTDRYGHEFFSWMRNFPFEMLADVNKNCNEEIAVVTILRYNFIVAIWVLADQGKREEAKKMYHQMQTVMPEDDFPYEGDEQLKEYMNTIKGKVGVK